MATTALIFVAVALALAVAVIWTRPELARRGYDLFVRFRNVAYAIIALSIMVVLLQTGSPTLMAIGAAILFVIVIALWADGPLGEVLG